MSLFFKIAHEPIDRQALQAPLHLSEAGGFCSFEGWVRNHNEGRAVNGLDYEVYEALATAEGRRILQEAQKKFSLSAASAVHRSGALCIGDIAVWIGVAAPHRDAAFKACRYIIDEIKKRLPVWKKEHYLDGDAQWVMCHHHEDVADR
ncbi:molybdenum cofactor biosynthesis protein MoaE [Saccharibacter sp. 17.LH.SD]|uniref:molybdenum cofactor biosynthesis protein MoaE n=1 Tax=Saccharibacter sp. 17.LH.SD TaxID=2689393 RepID=UPI00136ADA3E|nr:molybdenum cofactor biosynthesis protein MoaE [Saccharibacter sp. 17.LH.SD]MXV43774.1 molybdenum cofactor biosynthesis protein MoaE [Saccharibacter sp. 17.LH.SD]